MGMKHVLNNLIDNAPAENDGVVQAQVQMISGITYAGALRRHRVPWGESMNETIYEMMSFGEVKGGGHVALKICLNPDAIASVIEQAEVEESPIHKPPSGLIIPGAS